ncbi:hypothetical protein GCM10007916_01450 [Psychromonas marina]|uniref:Site-specific integrase n=1 Tax=Psychromonas marina TaxID=88364 RepID=A0ABQ6DVP0_9GAMM|nr:hypothetical protein [Psychromonas marina]GLS89078.1 hypothetical protein GCM10007916_01450 [Psychromonas marina]
MAKSPLAKSSKKTKATRVKSNVIPLTLVIPVKYSINRTNHNLDITHLSHRSCDSNNELIKARLPFIRKFAKNARKYMEVGKSVLSITFYYEKLRAYIIFCSYHEVNPFSQEGYLKYCGNDGELRHQVKMYSPSLRLWQRNHGDSIGLKESSCVSIQSGIITALTWCGAYNESWRHQHRPFNSRKVPFKPYSDSDEQIIVSRLSDLFFGLASQLVAIKKENTAMPDKIFLPINIDSHIEELQISTSLKPVNGKVNKYSAFNMAMGAAYHLFCYFTSLNKSTVLEVCHPIKIEQDSRDKTLRTVSVKAFKARANKDVTATLTNETDDLTAFDVEKRSGVTFIKLLSELSLLYGNSQHLLYVLGSASLVSNVFNIKEINKHLVKQLNLVSSDRILNMQWFRDLFYSFLEGNAIKVKVRVNDMGRSYIDKSTYPLSKGKNTKNILDISYCILSCFTNIPLKGALLPLTYSETDQDGNIRVSFSYSDGSKGFFNVPKQYLSLIKDIEKWANDRADLAPKTQQCLLLRYGTLNGAPKQWEGFSPISSGFMTYMSVKANDYFLTLQSSRFRETTSYQEYGEHYLPHLVNLLQNSLTTLERHYINGHSGTNKNIISQAIQVLERIATGNSLEQAKQNIKEKLGIDMLTHDEWLKTKSPTNPNGLMCNGLQNLKEGNNTQRATNKAMGRTLPCSEFDICYKCKSAKAVDEPNSIYKLISFIDVLKEALEHYPAAKPEVQAKIEAFEYTLEGASIDVLEEAWKRFNQSGRHPRITQNYALVSI